MAFGAEPDGRTTKELSGSFVFWFVRCRFLIGLSLLILELLCVVRSFVGACLQAMVRGVQAVYRQQAGSHKVYGTWLLAVGCFVGACLQAMACDGQAAHRQQAGSYKVCGTWLLVVLWELACKRWLVSACGLSPAIACGQ